MCMKDTIEFFGELDTLAREKPSEQRTRLIQVVLDNDFVEMILAMWTNDWKVEMLASNDELPTYLQTSLQVIYFLYVFIHHHQVRDDNGSAGHGSSGSTRVSTRDPLTHDQVRRFQEQAILWQ